MSILYVTSFAHDMYKMTGERLINSFLTKQESAHQKLLVCYENFEYKNPDPNRILTYPLHESEYLQNWLTENADIIPDYLGGKATKETNPKLFKNAWNRKASRWFRKVAALEYAHRTYGHQYQYLVWLDSDVYFTKTLPRKLILGHFNKVGVWYHLGKHRREKKKGFESGVIGFNQAYGGYPLLKRVFTTYQDKSFRKLARWDDGYVFRIVIEENNPKPKKFLIRDLIPDSIPSRGDVIPVGPFAKYLKHEKGSHARKKIMV